ncbi:hypothetical protein ACIF9R_35810 [Streptomyces sp. NPDC086080]|uniref:hypothetical protein n=1 Tax=Streptomyces sp. NPDC086080 TaxID=3365748 RepID=UPI0037D1553A
MLDCERTREELAVHALAGDRYGRPDAGVSEHLGQCAECSAEQERFTEVTLMLSRIGLPSFEGLPAAVARTVPGQPPGARARCAGTPGEECQPRRQV